MTRNIAIGCLVLFAVTLGASQTTDSKLVRFGKVGQALTNAEVEQITDLAISAGKRPWLLLGLPVVMSGFEHVTLYLQPDVTGARVQRGRMLRLVAERPPFVPVRSAWRISESLSYACIAAPGRRPGEISSKSDIGWPFAVEGEFDDDMLISIVAFIRSQPRIPMPAFRKEVPNAPISTIARRDDAIVVGLLTGDSMWDQVWLASKNGQWVITRSETSIA
jgi:hypothetical protein